MRGISPQANRATNSPTKQPRAVGHNLSLSQRRSQSFSHFRQGSARGPARRGFTIVELLIVVVVIAILAAITLVAYNGITANARESALKADLNTTAKKVGVAQAETGSYPSSKPAGLPDTIQYSQTSSGQGFCATASKDGKAFHITQDGTIQNGACSGHTIAGGGGSGGGGGTEIAANSPIQNVTSAQCQALPEFTGSNTSAIRTVTDNRGGTTRTYEMAKLADGKCWMLTNLKLGSTSGPITLTPADSNVASNFTLPQLTTGGASEFDLPRAYGPVPGDTGSGATNYGYLYNFAAATAGETQASLTTGNAQHSICPANWGLPSGGGGSGNDSELSRVNRELKDLTTELGDAARFIEMAIDLVEQSASAYRRAPEHIRRQFNQILFERIEVVMDENDDHQLRAVLAPPFDELFSATLRSVIEQREGQRDEEKDNPAISGGVIPVDFSISHALVSNKSTMVGLTGFEPATP